MAGFTLTGLPPGPLELIVSYTGLRDERRTISVGGDYQGSLSFELSPEDLVVLEKFTVASEREGDALAITNQRNALNFKNVVATDSFGTIPNMGVGELLLRLPGVAPVYDPQGRVGSVSVRGMPSEMASTTIDGNPAFRGNGARITGFIGLVGAFIEQVELTKGHTPDQSANSLGGGVNLRTASPLNMKEKRRFSYNVAGRWAPSFFEHTRDRLDHPAHPLISLEYQEAFSVAGGERNLGVSAGVFYSGNVTIQRADGGTRPPDPFRLRMGPNRFVPRFAAGSVNHPVKILRLGVLSVFSCAGPASTRLTPAGSR